jgi:taurine dioxygenase
MSATYNTIEVEPLSEFVGAEVSGIDLSENVGEESVRELRQAFGEHGVLFFRDQSLTPAQHIAFAKLWGDLNVNRFFNAVEGHPQIAQVLKEPHHNKNVGGGWHTDHTYDQIPALGSALYAKEVPSSGGDTLFASLGAAFESLSEGLKTTLRGLHARHSSRHVFGPARYETPEQRKEWEGRMLNSSEALQDAIHPVIIKHPLTGREILYVNAGFTLGFEGWTDEESKSLLSYLYEHAVQPQFTCRFQWKRDSLALWDNRATWHYALNDYPGERRFMHRITIEGEPLH